MKRIFLDTNILLDVVMRRSDFYLKSALVWADCENRKVQGLISAISLNNIHYIMRKQVEPAAALEYIRFILDIFSIVPLDYPILRLAANQPSRDFEDAIQIYSAVLAKADCIVTRDRQHFSNDHINIISPEEYLDLSK